MSLSNRLVLIAGSAAPAAPTTRLASAVALVRAVTQELLSRGAGVIVFCGAEPLSAESVPLVFDWIVLEEVEQSTPDGQERAVVVTSAKGQGKMSDTRRALLQRLVARRVAKLVLIADEIHTGGNITAAQIASADAMIAVAGGKGVLDRALKMIELQKPVVPINVSIGSASADGTGSVGLYQRAISEPSRFMPATAEALSHSLGALSLDREPVDVRAIATDVVTLLEREFAARSAARKPEALLLTVLPVELEATRRAVASTEHTMETVIGTNYWLADVPTAQFQRQYRVATACIGAPGNVAAAIVTGDLISAFQPKLVLLVGIAAGIRGKCRIGDVVLSERVVAYEGAALTDSAAPPGLWAKAKWLASSVAGTRTRENRPDMYRLPHEIEQDVVAYLASEVSLARRVSDGILGLGLSLPANETGSARQILPRLATIASGEKLLRDPSILKGLRGSLHGKIEVGEMEAAGVAETCRRLKTDFLVVRGISDYGDGKKDDNAHRLASGGAAVVAADFLKNGLRLAT